MKLLIDYYNCDLEEVNEALKSGIVKVEGYNKESEKLLLYCKNKKVVEFYHEQDCCENVWLEDGDGLASAFDIFTDCDWCKLEVVERCNGDEGVLPLDKYDDSYTWTFYKFTTNKGYDTIRWYGTSNGYYSESVDFRIWKEQNNDTNNGRN